MRGQFFAASMALSLAACASTGVGGRGAENYAEQSPLGAEMTSTDARALEPAFLQAMEAGAAGERFDWKGADASGWVKAREARLGDLKADPNDRPPMPSALVLGEMYETEQGLYALTSNANARLGPSTEHPILEQLISGTGVTVVGKVVGKTWMLVEADGRIRGYVSDKLMIKAPGTELELAGGPRKAAVFCRGFEQRLSVGGRSDQWDGVACREDGRWVLKSPSPDAPEKLF
ncbi:MAG: SH3 domain-containing protein [Parvularculaceae bacterium]|nr:SH3 domain-containing protein [Parvularculaceae bacterium]